MKFRKLVRQALPLHKVLKAYRLGYLPTLYINIVYYFLWITQEPFQRKFLFRLRRPEHENVQRWERKTRFAMNLKNLFTLQPFVLDQKLKLQGRLHKKRINFGNTAHSNVHRYMLRWIINTATKRWFSIYFYILYFESKNNTRR